MSDKGNRKMDVVNPLFLEEAGDYLEAAKFKRLNSMLTEGVIYFLKGDTAIEVQHNKVTFMLRYDEEVGQRTQEWKSYMVFEGIAELDMFKWMLLFHMADVVPLQHLIKAAKSKSTDVQDFNVNQMAEDIFSKVNTKSIPVNY